MKRKSLILLLLLQFCGNTIKPTSQLLSFADDRVPFQNTSCSTSITLRNSATVSYSLGLMTAHFVDSDGNEFQVAFSQSQVAHIFSPPTIGAGGFSQGDVTFDLQNTHLTPPLTATVIVVGITGQQVAHFIGNFSCE